MLGVTPVIHAKHVDKVVAARVANEVLKKQVIDATPNTFLECYLFVGADGKGFAIIAADDCVRPLLAYSSDGSFDPDHMPAHVASWIDGYQREIASVVAAGIAPSPQVQAMWETLIPSKSGSSVAPLLTTRWAQRPYYNSLCPYDIYDSAYAVTGCTATAMAQIMKYWEWPLVGWNSHTYVHQRYGTLSADFGNTIYRWDRMPDTLNALCDSLEIDAVAILMHHAGVAVEMNYGTRASGAATVAQRGFTQPCAENALKTYFRYNPLLFGSTKAGYSDSEWDAMLRGELDAARPVLYSGYDDNSGGHAFVLDGYDTLGMFHVNWGWGGYYDAYYTIDSLSPGAGSMGGDAVYTFNSRNGAIFNVYPWTETSSDTIVTVNIAVNDTTLGYIEGNGTYSIYDTVTIIPHAAEGCRFQRLTSGRNNLPLTFLAVSNIFGTLFFERIEGDTVGYCNDNVVTAWHDDYSSTTEWGIRIPPIMRRSRQLTAVQLYVYMGGNFTMNIYDADSLDGATPVYTDEFYITDDEAGWNTLQLDSVLTFHYTKTVWITFSITTGDDRYPAACASFCGNSDGSWYHLPDGWQPYDQYGEYYTWMIRAILDSRDRFHVAATPNDIYAGDVTGMGFYAPGDTVTLNALPHNGYQFSHWGNGDTVNPMHFVITCDTAFIAYFIPVTGIEEIENSELKVEINGLVLNIENPTDRPVSLYDITGRLLATSQLSSFTFHLPAPGVYLLKMEGLPARKIVVVK